MKTTPLARLVGLFCAVLLGSAALLSAAPRLQPSHSPLQPASTLDLIFDQAVVPAEKTGTPLENSLLKLTPPLSGKITWRSPNIARFTPTEPFAIGQRYQIELLPGLSHLDQSAVPATRFSALSTESFHRSQVIKRGSLRQPELILIFNDEADPASAAPFFQFNDESGQFIAAQTRRATYGDLNSPYDLRPTWQERFDGWQRPDHKELAAGQPLPNVLHISPVTPRPIDRKST
ncbi:MAG: hypothetical protein ACQKBY_12825, partial [Verrucomicrobiales bacterium]